MSPQDRQNSLQVLSAAMLKLLKPLVRILLRYGIPFAAFADLAKRTYVEVAADEFAIEGRKQTLSRVSVITGLSRKEVKRVSSLETPDDHGAVQRYNRAARVISGWVRDSEYTATEGGPVPLELEGSPTSFSSLVKKYSGDVPARAVLDELLRVEAVSISPEGTIRLKTRAYIPQSGEIDKLGILGVDVADLIATIEHNLVCDPEDSFFQRKVSYDNMPIEASEDLREKATERAQKLLEDLDGWMSQRDRDANPTVAGHGRRRASLGVYYYEENLPEDD